MYKSSKILIQKDIKRYKREKLKMWKYNIMSVPSFVEELSQV